MLISRTPAEASAVCLSCRIAARAFSTTSTRHRFGPEHPRYIEVPEPPQQSSVPKVEVKGILPVPRPLFTGKRGVPARRERAVQLATQDRQSEPEFPADSFLGWKSKVSSQRKQNLDEGTKELRARHDRMNQRRTERAGRRQREQSEAMLAPEREDERLTADSNNFNLEDLMRGKIVQPDRAQIFEESRERYTMREEEKKRIRADQLHTLYSKATSFIVTPEQLEAEIEKSFGTDQKPVLFNTARHNESEAYSIWAKGVPMGIRDMLDEANGKVVPSRGPGRSERPKMGEDRMRKVAEAMTGGALGE